MKHITNIELTDQEKEAVKAMMHTSPVTIWGLKVFQTVRGGTNEDIRKLIKELQSEGFANLPVMENILGKAAFEKVFECDYDDFIIEDMVEYSQSATF